MGVLAGTAMCPAQETPAVLDRFEVGFQTADIRTGCIGTRECYLPSAGVGVGGTVNLNRYFALDANWLTTTTSSTGADNFSGGRATEFLAGVRAGVRARRYEYFLVAQPGLLHWSDRITGVDLTLSKFDFTYGPATHFVSAVGAGFEVSPVSRVHLRGTVSDLVEKQYSAWKNNLQPSIGLYYGVGSATPWTPPVYRIEQSHRFFDRTYFALTAGNQLAATADSVTTYQFMQRGIQEGNPINRPLVKYGVPGLISLQILEAGLETAGMYGLHRIGHHWIERAIPFLSGVDHAVFAYNNTKHYSR